MRVIRQSVNAPSRPLSEETLKHNRNERGTNIPSGVYVDLAAHDAGCVLVCATAGNDYKQGGIKIAEGSWNNMKYIYDQAGGEKNGYIYHIRIPNGTYFPDDCVQKRMTFTEALLAGQAKITEIDDWVDNWHNDSGNSGQTLQDYLGLDQETYAAWLKNADALIGLEDRLRSQQNEISKQKLQTGTHDPV